MLEIRFRAGTKTLCRVAGILLIILYRQINFFDQVAGTKFHAGMLEIRFHAGITLYLRKRGDSISPDRGLN